MAERVLVSCPLAGDVLDTLRATHSIEVGERATGLGKSNLMRRLADHAGLITLLTDVVDDEVLQKGAGLKIIANHAVGVDNIDLDACRARGVRVANTPDVLTDATADFAMSLMLGACRRLPEALEVARSGSWPGWSPTELVGKRVSGSVLGVIGAGRIGRAVTTRARGFSMTVIYTQRNRLPEAIELDLGMRYLPLDALLRESDIVSLHCPLTRDTKNLLGAPELALMKRDAVIINTARGGCIDQGALEQALRAGQLGGAGLDVFAGEPAIPMSLTALPNVLATPHIASADMPTRVAMGGLCVSAVLAVLAGREPQNLVV